MSFKVLTKQTLADHIDKAQQAEAMEQQAQQFGMALADVCEFTCNRLQAPNNIQVNVFLNLAAKCANRSAVTKERFMADVGRAWDMAEEERVKAGGKPRDQGSLVVTQ